MSLGIAKIAHDSTYTPFLLKVQSTGSALSLRECNNIQIEEYLTFVLSTYHSFHHSLSFKCLPYTTVIRSLKFRAAILVKGIGIHLGAGISVGESAGVA